MKNHEKKGRKNSAINVFHLIHQLNRLFYLAYLVGLFNVAPRLSLLDFS